MRRTLKTVLGSARSRRAGRGVVVLTYHRVGGGSPDERDVSIADFTAQVEALRDVDVVPLDTALDRLERDASPNGTVITIDDGFRDVYDNAWPLLRRHRLPFTLYLTTAYVGGTMDWPGSTARAPGPALTWDMVREMVGSGLCTLGNHTHTHVPATALTTDELDECTHVVRERVGVEPRTSRTRGASSRRRWRSRLRAGSARPSPAASAATARASTRGGWTGCPCDAPTRRRSSAPS